MVVAPWWIDSFFETQHSAGHGHGAIGLGQQGKLNDTCVARELKGKNRDSKRWFSFNGEDSIRNCCTILSKASVLTESPRRF
jgi:hypothetical protein